MDTMFEDLTPPPEMNQTTLSENCVGSVEWWKQIIEMSNLQEIQDRLAKKMRVGAIITTLDGTPITRPSQFSKFCQAMRELPSSREVCFLSDSTGGERAGRAKRVVLYRCPHGLLDMASPIVLDNVQVGVLLCGQVRLSDYTEEQFNKIVDSYWNHVDEKEIPRLKELFMKTERVDRRIIRMAMELLHLLTSQIVAQCERQLLERQSLQREIAIAQIKNRKERLERTLKQTQLKSLESQLNPHFMFNTLNVISRLALFEGAEKTQSLIIQFSGYLRYVLQQQARDDKVSLKMEIECIERYLSIYKIRLGNRLDYRLDINPKTESLLVPFMLLQPLVENAILHGIEPLPEGGSVSIFSALEGKKLTIKIEDDGIGFESKEAKYGIGLKNVMQRVQLYYGKNGSVNIEAKQEKGCCIVITIPAS